jgi:hypothetical protein
VRLNNTPQSSWEIVIQLTRQPDTKKWGPKYEDAKGDADYSQAHRNISAFYIVRLALRLRKPQRFRKDSLTSAKPLCCVWAETPPFLTIFRPDFGNYRRLGFTELPLYPAYDRLQSQASTDETNNTMPSISKTCQNCAISKVRCVRDPNIANTCKR